MPSCRKYTVNWPRWWYQWLSMIDRSIAARGTAKSSRSPFISRHVAISVASSIPPSTFLALAMLWSSAGMRSELQVGLGSWPNCGACAGEGEATNSATAPGTIAICSASWPSVLAFSCGRHPSRLSGTRSRTRRVVRASSSSSRSMPSMSGIGLPFHLLDPAPDAVYQKRPALRQLLAIAFREQADRRVAERDRGPPALFLEPVLKVRGHAERHHERSRDLEQRGPLDCLHVTPQVSVAVAQVAEPAAAGPSLELHGHGGVVVPLVGGAYLLEQRRERRGDGRADVNFLHDVERQIVDGWGDCGHGCFLGLVSLSPLLASCSARCLIRVSWSRQ